MLPFNDELKGLGLPTSSPVELQTKDLECLMICYEISSSGFLRHKEYKSSEIVKDTNHPFGMYIDLKDPYFVDDAVTTTIRAYDYCRDIKGKWDVYYEFEFAFLDGRLAAKRLVECTIEDNTERKTREKQFLKELEVKRNKWYNKYLFYTKPWGKVRRVLHTMCYKAGNSMHWVSHRIP